MDVSMLSQELSVKKYSFTISKTKKYEKEMVKI